MYLLIYVDDIIFICSFVTAVDCIVIGLGGDFAVKDLGKLYFFHGLEVVHRDTGLNLTQKYSMKFLHVQVCLSGRLL
jgi:hypothetical protein